MHIFLYEPQSHKVHKEHQEKRFFGHSRDQEGQRLLWHPAKPDRDAALPRMSKQALTLMKAFLAKKFAPLCFFSTQLINHVRLIACAKAVINVDHRYAGSAAIQHRE